MRHVRMVEGIFAMYEDFAYLLGDAEDFVERERTHLREIVDDVADAKISTGEAKRQIDALFANASRQIAEARALAALNARRAGFTHLPEALPSGWTPSSPTLGALPGFRIIKPLPGGVA